MIYLLYVVIFFVAAGCWLAWRSYRPGERPSRLILVLDWIFILPLLPIAYLIGRFNR